jgi:hypothetical protein
MLVMLGMHQGAVVVVVTQVYHYILVAVAAVQEL